MCLFVARFSTICWLLFHIKPCFLALELDTGGLTLPSVLIYNIFCKFELFYNAIISQLINSENLLSVLYSHILKLIAHESISLGCERCLLLKRLLYIFLKVRVKRFALNKTSEHKSAVAMKKRHLLLWKNFLRDFYCWEITN